jgi:drug/metabolite transporter (DMT)-like permease
MEEHPLHRRKALMLFAVVVISWGLNWLVTKTLVHSVPPLWTTSIRSATATVALLLLLLARGQLIIPRRGDVPVIVAVALLHMVGFSALVAFGLQFVPVGRSVVLGYTTPLWVTPGAWLFLKEPLTRSRAVGVGLGLLGLVVMFNPFAFDWGNRDGLIGNGLILLAAFCWAANILYVRAHKWIATPFQLLFWQTLLATSILSVLALLFDGPPQIDWNSKIVAAFLYGGIFGTALAY